MLFLIEAITVSANSVCQLSSKYYMNAKLNLKHLAVLKVHASSSPRLVKTSLWADTNSRMQGFFFHFITLTCRKYVLSTQRLVL